MNGPPTGPGTFHKWTTLATLAVSSLGVGGSLYYAHRQSVTADEQQSLYTQTRVQLEESEKNWKATLASASKAHESRIRLLEESHLEQVRSLSNQLKAAQEAAAMSESELARIRIETKAARTAAQATREDSSAAGTREEPQAPQQLVGFPKSQSEFRSIVIGKSAEEVVLLIGRADQPATLGSDLEVWTYFAPRRLVEDKLRGAQGVQLQIKKGVVTDVLFLGV